VPFSELKKDTRAFVAVSSIPNGSIIKDPRNMHRDQIQNLLRHWCQRQEQLGPESAFGFGVVMGPKKKRLFAEYPNIGAPKAKAKGKGKQTEVPHLDGLLPISPTGTPTPSDSPIESPNPTPNYSPIESPDPTPRGSPIESVDPTPSVSPLRSSNPNATQTPKPSEFQLHAGQQVMREHQVGSWAEGLVRIDMGQMMRLKNMGLQITGPVNGPNEGLPQYEVPRRWLLQLEEEPIDIAESASGPTVVRPYPRPRPITKKLAPRDKAPIIDPALASNAQGFTTPTTEQQQGDAGDDPIAMVHLPSASASGPQSNPNIDGTSVLGKRDTIVCSPPRKTQV